MARLQLVLAALLFSTGGVAIKLATLGGWQVAGLRAAVAAVAMFVVLPTVRRGWSWRTLVVAIPYAATFVLYSLANKETTAANAIFLQDTAPLYLLLLGPLLLGERLRRSDLALATAMAVGAVLLFAATPVAFATAPRPALGNALALAAGVTWALSLLGLRWISVRGEQSGEEPLAVIVAGCLLALLGSVGALWPEPLFPNEQRTLANVAIVLYLGICQIGLAYVFLTRGVRHVTALEASLLLLTEPVFTPILAWLVLGESLSMLALAGGAVVIGAVAAHSWWRGVSSAAS
jgi:drug/metabolite transporter (DMT)-like permease